jgi:hypothetical protein
MRLLAGTGRNSITEVHSTIGCALHFDICDWSVATKSQGICQRFLAEKGVKKALQLLLFRDAESRVYDAVRLSVKALLLIADGDFCELKFRLDQFEQQ